MSLKRNEIPRLSRKQVKADIKEFKSDCFYLLRHTTIGKIPGELAGLKLDVGVNIWLGLIRLSHKGLTP